MSKPKGPQTFGVSGLNEMLVMDGAGNIQRNVKRVFSFSGGRRVSVHVREQHET